jgi:hypothetical protein
MSKKKIKSLDEYYSQTLTGDSFNSSNGVFKVDYKPFQDLSISVGRDPDPSILIKDSRFGVGDFVKGNVNGRKKKVVGEIIEVSKSQDGKFYIIKIQSERDKKTHTLVPGSIEFVEDRGNSTNVMGMNVSARERMAQNTKYNGGNIVWGSLESETQDFIPVGNRMGETIDCPFGTGWKAKIVEQLPQGETMFGCICVDPTQKIISCLSNPNTEKLKNIIKAAEAQCFLAHHEDLKNHPLDLKSLMSVIFLDMKNEPEAKKVIVQYFPEITGKSYGECKDLNYNQAKSMINRFL